MESRQQRIGFWKPPPVRKQKNKFWGNPEPPYRIVILRSDIFMQANVFSVHFAFAPDGELLAVNVPLDQNNSKHVALLAKARERAGKEKA